MTAIREAGFSIPEDFAVVGYDDIPSAAFAFPPLTTIRSHAFEQGKMVGEATIALVNGKKIGRHQSVLPLRASDPRVVRRQRQMIAIENLSKKFGGVSRPRPIELTIETGELFFLLGPSGCGKTTLLRHIAGFYQPDEGRILFDGKDVTRVPPHLRNTGMVFQNYALWPHLTVEKNVAFGLEERKIPKAEIDRRVTEALARGSARRARSAQNSRNVRRPATASRPGPSPGRAAGLSAPG